MEAILLACFLLGYLAFRLPALEQHLPAHGGLAAKQLAADFGSGNYDAVLSRVEASPTVDGLGFAVRALAELGREPEAPALAERALRRPHMRSSAAFEQVKDARCAHELRRVFEAAGVQLDSRLIAELFDVGLEELVQLADAGHKLPAKAHCRLIRGASGQEALVRVEAMLADGYFVPTALLASVGRNRPRELAALKLTSEAFGHLVEHLCRSDEEGALELASAASERGTAVPYAARAAILRSLAYRSDARAFPWLEELKQSFEVTESTACAVLSACADARNVQLAEAALKAVTPSCPVYVGLMRVYNRARCFEKVCDLAVHLPSDAATRGCVIKAAVECGRLDLARRLLQECGTVDAQNYMSLFRACGRERNGRKALELLRELERSAQGCDLTAYNCVFDVLTQCGEREQAAELFATMKSAGYIDVISYNTLLKGGQADPEAVIAEMRAAAIQPNVITYNSVINTAVSKGDLQSAWKFVSLMKLDGIQVDKYTCSIMIKGLKHSTSREDVDRTLSMIEQSQVIPDEVLVKTVLDVCIRLRDVKRMTSALRALSAAGVPSQATYATVIRAYGHARALDEAKGVWEEMLAHKVRPTEAVFASMMDAMVHNDAVDDAVALLGELKATIPDFSADVVYTPLLRALGQRKEVQKALAVYDDMRREEGRPLPLVSYNALIDLCARADRVDDAARVFKEMIACGVQPDVITYTTVIKGYCVSGSLEPALQLFQLMRTRGVHPDAVLFNAILDGCMRSAHTSLAEAVFSDMESSGVQPSSTTLHIMIRLYAKTRDVDKALTLVETLPPKYGFVCSTAVYSSLVGLCAAVGRMDEAGKIFERLDKPEGTVHAALIQGYLKQRDVARALRLLTRALDSHVLDRQLIESVLFMAKRRKMADQCPWKKLAPLGFTK